MTPAFQGALGFAPDEPGADSQAAALQFFRQTCARRMRPAFAALGLSPVDDVWQLLVGRRTFLWGFPEFQPLPPRPGYHHTGPIRWSGWPRPDLGAEHLADAAGIVNRYDGVAALARALEENP